MHCPRRVIAMAEGIGSDEIPDMSVFFPIWSPEVEDSVDKYLRVRRVVRAGKAGEGR